MAKSRLSWRRNTMFKNAVEKMQKSLSKSRRSSLSEESDFSMGVAKDVKEGHFAVLAIDGSGPKRFVVSLNCLEQPAFLRLLEQAEEEFGFNQEGTLTIPCQPSELESILREF
ncbi:auxin-responsive protein SAUR21-like [Tasmannia lanceolata]|uniref:auxin-responsive protein SAUR21-like n=1 Tax=Tasmannia lanceolata TaxID=3420 RepID=UPI0040641A0C